MAQASRFDITCIFQTRLPAGVCLCMSFNVLGCHESARFISPFKLSGGVIIIAENTFARFTSICLTVSSVVFSTAFFLFQPQWPGVKMKCVFDILRVS